MGYRQVKNSASGAYYTMYGHYRGRHEYANMVRVREPDPTEETYESFAYGSFPQGAEVWSAPTPNLDQDCIQTQGVSPGLEFDHSDHILDRSTQEQRHDLLERHQAAALMDNWEPPWTGLSSEQYQYTPAGIYTAAFLPQFSERFMYPQTVNHTAPSNGPSPLPLSAHQGFGEPDASPSFSSLSARQQHGLYPSTSPSTTAQDHRDEDYRSGRPNRGGRRPGMNLTADTLANSRKVRKMGACLRCRVLREKCSEEIPCLRCSETAGRKWKGCFRSFKELRDSLIPPILAARLSRASYEDFMKENTRYDVNPTWFPLPVNFGFGLDFQGFSGREYLPSTEESYSSYAVFLGEGGRNLPRCFPGLPIYATYTDQKRINSQLIEWLKATLLSSDSMEEWRNACFPGMQGEWMRHLLQQILNYSHQCWREDHLSYHKINETLVHTWMVTLLATMLSLQITVPQDSLPFVLSHVQLSNPSSFDYSNSSRPINKSVKSLLLHMYKSMISKVMAELDELVKPSRAIDGREWGHMYCISILLVAIISQVQMSLMDNYSLDAERHDRRGQWEQTVNYLEQLEAVYKNITLVFHWKQKQATPGHSRDARGGFLGNSHHIADPRLRELVRGIQAIRHMHQGDVYRYRKDELQVDEEARSRFNAVNTQRLFAFYFNLMYPEHTQ